MNKPKIDAQKIMQDFDFIEEKINAELELEEFTKFCKNLQEEFKTHLFQIEDVRLVQTRLNKLQQIFSEQKESIKQQSQQLLSDNNKLQNYYKNLNLR